MGRNLSMFTIKSAVVVVLATCAAYFFFVIGPTAESRYFPVLGKLKLTKIKEDGPDSSLVMATFRKKRDCDYLGIAWYRLLPNGATERIAIVLRRKEGDESSPNRPLGVSVTGPWEVAMPAQQIPILSVVEVFHRCHPFWTTRTPFYP